MSTMFSKLSKLRSRSSSRNASSLSPQVSSSPQPQVCQRFCRNQRAGFLRVKARGDILISGFTGGDLYSHDDNENDRYNLSLGKLPSQISTREPHNPPIAHLIPKSSTVPLGKHSIPSVAPLIENHDSDSDDNVSFAECLFPITPPGEVLLGRRLSYEIFMSDEDLSPNAASPGPQMSSVVFDLKKQVGKGRRSVDLTRKNSWGSHEGVRFGEAPIGRKSSWERKKADSLESRRATWEASYKRIWEPDGLKRGKPRSWTSSSVPEEAIDTGPAVLPPHEDAEDEFLEEFEDYFNHLQVDNVRRSQYPKLELQKLVYLDYASFPLFSNFQVEEHLKILLAEGPCLGSASVSSSTDNPLFMHVAETQKRLLGMLNTTPSHYSIIFTAGFQESFRLVAESYPFQKGSPLLVCQDNDAAVRPVIRSAHRAGGRLVLSPVTEKELCFHSHDLHKLLRQQTGRNANHGGLFLYPAQSNLSGIKHSLSWVVEAQQNGWNVCLDATTLFPTSALDLDIHQPDLVVGSFHHMLGYPSGMGYLLVRRESFCVQASVAEKVQLVRNKPADEGEHCHILCPADNTMNLLQFAALSLGLLHLERIGFSAIQKRVRALAQWLVQRLRALRHKENAPRHLLRVYGSHATKDRGSIVSFNVIDPSGTLLPPDIVRKLAARSKIMLSVGSFNNPGLSNLLGDHPRSNDVSILEENWGSGPYELPLEPSPISQTFTGSCCS